MYRILGLIAALGLLLGAWWYVHTASVSPQPEQETSMATSTPTTQWQWIFDPAGADATGTPKTNVILRNGDTSYAIGTFLGSCFDVSQSDWKLLEKEGEFAGAICYFAGRGNEIGVFSEGGKALIQVGDVDEGDAEHPPVRGNFKTLFEITFGFVRSMDTTHKTVLFDDALWLTGKSGEDAAIAKGLCTEDTRSECLPNDFYILNEKEVKQSLPLADTVAVYLLTWHAETKGIQREYIKLDDFAALLKESSWSNRPYNVSLKDGKVIMIEEVYVP